MLLMHQSHSFCDVLWTSEHTAHSYKTRFLHSSQSFFGHGAMIAAKNPCWQSLSAFHNHLAARRYVRSTWNQCFFAYFWETLIFQKSCSRRGGSSIFKVWTLPKANQNREKIDIENVLFFNIDFFGFWPRFWNLLGPQFGAKFAILAPKN